MGLYALEKDGVWAYEVETRSALHENILPFFERFQFLSTKKKKDFSRFKKIINVLEGSNTTTLNDLKEILKIS